MPALLPFTRLVTELTRLDLQPIEFASSGGRAVLVPNAGRIVGLRFETGDENLFWANPAIAALPGGSHGIDELPGGLGGDRLWFGKELTYFWNGSPDWESFANYEIPPSADPGTYALTATTDAVRFSGRVTLEGRNGAERTSFNVTRTVSFTEPPFNLSDESLQGADFVGLETSNEVEVDPNGGNGIADLWHLLQVPTSSQIVIPLRKGSSGRSVATSFGMPGSWSERHDRIEWEVTGLERAKLGVSAGRVTGKVGVVRQMLDGRVLLLVRSFSVDPAGTYVDHPEGQVRSDQAVQAWSGFGFGEIEHRSTAFGAELPSTVIEDRDQIWAFGGSRDQVNAIAVRLLGVDIRKLVIPPIKR